MLHPDVALSETEQRQDATFFFLIGQILFLHYEESLVLSNLDSKLFRFHCVRPNVPTHQLNMIYVYAEVAKSTHLKKLQQLFSEYVST